MAEDEETLSLFDSVVNCSRDDEGTQAAALERLISLSRSLEVRVVLATRDAVPSLLPLIDQGHSLLLLVLRLLRNLCAGVPLNQNAFLRADGVKIVASVVDRTLERKHVDMVSVLQVSLQLLGNVCGAGGAQKYAVWKAFFPDKFRTLALLENESQILEPLCMVIYTCCHDNTDILEDLCLHEGAFLLTSCLRAVRNNDWMPLLLVELLSDMSLVPRIFASLQGPYVEEVEIHLFTAEQVTLLSCLLDFLDEEHALDNLVKSKINFLGVAEFLGQILRDASVYYSKLYASTSSGESLVTGPSGSPVIDVLGYSLELLKLLSGLDCGDQESGSTFNRSSVVHKLLQDGVIELCLELLKDLGPPELIMRAMQHSNADVMDNIIEHDESTQQNGLKMMHHTNVLLKRTMGTLPYRGYRRDLVAVIGNAAYQQREVQDAVRNWGPLFVLLEQCVVDDPNPYLREWGLWAVRNLLHGNIENSKEVAELQLRGTATPIELADMGYKVEIDSELGRPKLVIMPSEKA